MGKSVTLYNTPIDDPVNPIQDKVYEQWAWYQMGERSTLNQDYVFPLIKIIS